ncbi:MAG: hypothetical protein RL009_134 [Actinomycetota bacterium]|jgi:hypothetical protein
MAAPRRNSRNLSPQIYRRRRIVVLVIVGLLLWGIIAGVSAVFGWVGSMLNPTPSASPSQTVTEGQPCASGDVQVVANVGNAEGGDIEAFATGQNPYLWFKITNIGTVSCTFDAGPAVQFFEIKSGNDLIWDSHNCDRTGLDSQVLTLEPGAPQASPPVAWLRVRSSSTGCGVGQEPVNPGAYTLVAEVNGVLSDKNQFLLN